MKNAPTSFKIGAFLYIYEHPVLPETQQIICELEVADGEVMAVEEVDAVLAVKVNCVYEAVSAVTEPELFSQPEIF